MFVKVVFSKLIFESLLSNMADLQFYRIMREILIGHDDRVLAAPLEQGGEPGLVL